MPVQGKQIFRRAARAAHGHILLLETYVSSSGRRQKTPGFSGEADRTYGDRTKHVKKARQRYPASVSQAPGRPSLRTAAACKSTRNEADRPFFSTFCRLSGMVVLMLPYGSAAQWPGAGFGRRGVHVRTQEAATPAKATLPLLCRTALVREDAASGMNMPPIPGRRESSPATGRSSAFTGTFPAFIRHRGMFFDQRAHNMLRHHPGRRIP